MLSKHGSLKWTLYTYNHTRGSCGCCVLSAPCSIRTSLLSIITQLSGFLQPTLWSETSKAWLAVLCCKKLLMICLWWRTGDFVLSTSAASQWLWTEVRARWHCWDWRWKVLVIEDKWNYSEGNYTDEWSEDADCAGWVKSSALFLLPCRCCCLSCQCEWVQWRQRWRRAGSAGAAAWRWSGGKSLADPHWCGWRGSQKDCHYAAETHQKQRPRWDSIIKQSKAKQSELSWIKHALFYQRHPV